MAPVDLTYSYDSAITTSRLKKLRVHHIFITRRKERAGKGEAGHVWHQSKSGAWKFRSREHFWQGQVDRARLDNPLLTIHWYVRESCVASGNARMSDHKSEINSTERHESLIYAYSLIYDFAIQAQQEDRLFSFWLSWRQDLRELGGRGTFIFTSSAACRSLHRKAPRYHTELAKLKSHKLFHKSAYRSTNFHCHIGDT